MSGQTINRDPSEQTAGFRLQKLRATQVMLEHFIANPSAHFWCSIEKDADVSIEKNDSDGALHRNLEEDKNYAPSNTLSFNSGAILNTLVMNIDSLHQFGFDPNSVFTFYTSTTFTKEGRSNFTKENELEFPEEPVFNFLNSTVAGGRVENFGEALENDELIDLLSKIVLNEYESQYAGKKINGNIDSVRAWDLNNWKDFFKRIHFYFGEPDYKTLYSSVEQLIKATPLYNDILIGKEGIIISALLEEVENTQFQQGTSKGYATNKSIELIYEKVKNGNYLPVDPSWISWEKVEKPKDIRNVEEKITAVIPTPEKKFIDRINRRAANGLTKVLEHDGDKSIKAILYIIYDCCEEEISDLIKNKQLMTEQEIKDNIDVLVDKSHKDIEEKATNYSYIVTNKKSIRELILYLVDSCYLAFN